LTWSDLLISQANFANFFPNYSQTSSRTVRFGSVRKCISSSSVQRFSKMHTSRVHSTSTSPCGTVIKLAIVVSRVRLFPDLYESESFGPLLKDSTQVRPIDSKFESGLKSDLSSPKLGKENFHS
jgi:hypothetical protein